MKITHRYVYMLVHIVQTTIHNSQQTNDNLFEHKNLKIRARTLMEFQSSKYSEVPNKRSGSKVGVLTDSGELVGVPGVLAPTHKPYNPKHSQTK